MNCRSPSNHGKNLLGKRQRQLRIGEHRCTGVDTAAFRRFDLVEQIGGNVVDFTQRAELRHGAVGERCSDHATGAVERPRKLLLERPGGPRAVGVEIGDVGCHTRELVIDIDRLSRVGEVGHFDLFEVVVRENGASNGFRVVPGLDIAQRFR